MNTPPNAALWQHVLHSGPIVLGTLVLLILASVICWGVILFKWLYIRQALRESRDFLEQFWQSKSLDAVYQLSQTMTKSPLAQVFRAGFIELSKIRNVQKAHAGGAISDSLDSLDNVERALKRAAVSEITQLESTVPFLATTGSTAPFIGLFGTVWGIMKAFEDIGRMGTANLATVAPGISEALVATATGLAAAIPAVVAYNYFVSKIKVLEDEMETFSSDLLNILKRSFL